MIFFKKPVTAIGVSIVILSASSLIGCQRTEKVIDIETPGVDIEVERDKDSGRVDVDVNE